METLEDSMCVSVFIRAYATPYWFSLKSVYDRVHPVTLAFFIECFGIRTKADE